MILDERGFSGFEDWAERASGLLARYGNPPTIISAKDWQRWAAAVCEILRSSGQVVPSPYAYSAWRAWVQDFNQAAVLPVV